MSPQTYRIGNFQIAVLLELEAPAFKATDLFPALAPDALQAAREKFGASYIDENDLLVMAFRTFVLRTPNHNILIDTCVGNQKDRPDRPMFHKLSSDYLVQLSALGLHPEDIDVVMCTHLHWDHVGWNTQLVNGNWVPTFPNARHVIAKAEYDYWNAQYAKDPDARHARAFADSVAPIARAEQALLVNQDFELESGISLEGCPGHTVGNVIINIASGDGRGVFAGDVLQHPLQLLYPELSSRPDYDQELSRKSRLAFLESRADTGCLVMPTHFPVHPAGRIVREQSHYAFAT